MENENKPSEKPLKDHPGIENLKPWPKGTSGNPKGKPKGPNSKTILKRLLELGSGEFDEDGKELTNAELIHCMTLMKAKEGNQKAYDAILDRYEGRPSQAIDFTERKPDDLEKMSTTELKNAGKEIIKKLQGKIDSGNSEIKEN